MSINTAIIFHSNITQNVLNSLADSKYIPDTEDYVLIIITPKGYEYLYNNYNVVSVDRYDVPKEGIVYVVLNGACGELLIPLIEKLTLSPLEFHCKKIELKTT